MDTDELCRRLERVERSNRRLRATLLALVAVAVGCGASTTVANFKTVRSHGIEVFGENETGSVVTLGRTTKGGRIEIKDAKGAVAWVLDSDGLHPGP